VRLTHRRSSCGGYVAWGDVGCARCVLCLRDLSTALHRTALHRTARHALHSTVLHCTHYTTLHGTALHRIALRGIFALQIVLDLKSPSRTKHSSPRTKRGAASAPASTPRYCLLLCRRHTLIPERP
jgi:hypothetical protein